MDKILERVARAIAAKPSHQRVKLDGYNEVAVLSVDFEDAKRAIVAHVAALAEEGFVVVPHEPTEAMLSADISGQWEWTGDFNKAARTHIYKAMIDKASE